MSKELMAGISNSCAKTHLPRSGSLAEMRLGKIIECLPDTMEQWRLLQLTVLCFNVFYFQREPMRWVLQLTPFKKIK